MTLTPTTPPTPGVQQRPHLSHSAVKQYQQCSERYRLERIARVETAPADALAVGVATHEALELLGVALRDGWHQRQAARRVQRAASYYPLPSVAQLVTRGLDVLDAEVRLRDKRGLWTPFEREQMRTRTRHAIEQFHQHVGRVWIREQADGDAWVEAVEESFRLPLVDLNTGQEGGTDTGYDYTGRVDIRRGLRTLTPDSTATEIADFKTSAKGWKPGAEHTDQQATAYAWAERERLAALTGRHETRPKGQRVIFHIVSVLLVETPGADPIVGYAPRPTLRTDAHIRAYQRSLPRVLDAIHAERFTPNPTPLCGWCGVLAHCPAGQAWLRAARRRPQPLMERHIEVVQGGDVKGTTGDDHTTTTAAQP